MFDKKISGVFRFLELATGYLGPFLVGRAALSGELGRQARRWFLPLLVGSALALAVGAQFTNHLRPSSMDCLGVTIYTEWGYPYGWLACPGVGCAFLVDWDPLGFVMSVLWWFNLGVCLVGLVGWLQHMLLFRLQDG